MKVLQIVSCAYRATSEEQDDTVVWITHAMKGAGGELDVLLRGNAVNYTVAAQRSEALSFGAWRQSQPPRLSRDVAGLIEKGVDVYIVEEDARERGLVDAELIKGIRRIGQDSLGDLVEHYDQVWQW